MKVAFGSIRRLSLFYGAAGWAGEGASVFRRSFFSRYTKPVRRTTFE